MTKIAVSGGSGYVGRFIVDRLLANRCEVVILGRNAPPKDLFERPVEFRHHILGEPLDNDLFEGCDSFVHAAFHHIVGRYRGGEGDDPKGFRKFNHDGSMALFNAAKIAGVERVIFLSSRAVYGKQDIGETLFETTSPNPDSLYGQVKLETEQALAKLGDAHFAPIIVRATGVYGTSKGSHEHKWQALFAEFEAGEKVAPRIGTEVHGEDLATAIDLLLAAHVTKNDVAPIYNISDILLDRRDLLEAYAQLRDIKRSALPENANAANFNMMNCDKLKNMGWKPRGALNLSQTMCKATSKVYK